MRLWTHGWICKPAREATMERRLRATLRGGEFAEVSVSQSKRMRAIKGQGNRSTERTLRMALVRGGISGFRLHDQTVRGCPDFYFPRERIAVFVDGCFWHGCRRCAHKIGTRAKYWSAKIQGNLRRDLLTSRRLRKSGVTVLRFWEHEVQGCLDRCVTEVRRSAGASGGAAPARRY